MLTRRTLLTAALASAGLPGAFAFAAPGTDRCLLVVLLRGGLDGLAAVPAVGDPDYAHARGPVALDPAETVALDGFFALHPAMAGLAPLWAAGELAVVHATALPGGGRSHFDAQDVLDNGTDSAGGAHSGWLNRATAVLDPAFGPPMALGRQVPLLLRGPERIRASDPLHTFAADPEFLAEVERMYAGDPELSAALGVGLETQAMLARHRSGKPGRRTLSPATARQIGSLLAASDGPRIGVIEVGGWDTHVRQGPALDNRLGELAEGLLAVKAGLGDAWRQTAVLAVSEFGRTVRGNGTGGTDHGTGGVALLAGGAVRGGQVVADWPGLAPQHLLAERDLKPTLDVRAVFKGLLVGHLGLDAAAVEARVFPGTSDVEPLLAPWS